MTTPDNDGNERLESLLRQFQPRRPGPLPRAGVRRPSLRTVAAAAAAIVLVGWGAVHFRFAGRDAVDAADLTAGRLPQSVDWNVDRLDRRLLELAPRVLPDVERPGSTFGRLAAP